MSWNYKVVNMQQYSRVECFNLLTCSVIYSSIYLMKYQAPTLY